MNAQQIMDKVDLQEGFTVLDYEDTEQLSRYQLQGEVNRLQYLMAILSVQHDKLLKQNKRLKKKIEKK